MDISAITIDKDEDVIVLDASSDLSSVNGDHTDSDVEGEHDGEPEGEAEGEGDGDGDEGPHEVQAEDDESTEDESEDEKDPSKPIELDDTAVDIDPSNPTQTPNPNKRRIRTPTPFLPPPQIRKTIRMSFELKRGEGLDVTVFKVVGMAKEMGLLPMDDGDIKADGKGDTKDKEKEQEAEKEKEKERETAEGGAVEPAPKRKKRGKNIILGRFGGYDTEDPFVDDEELFLYEPKFYHRPARAGFYVVDGPLDGLIAKKRQASAKKKKEKEKEEPAVSTVPAFGVENPLPPISRKKKKKGEFSEEMQREFDMLRSEVSKESFEVKHKFPPRLKPILVQVALRAIALDEYDDDFFSQLPTIFPYNNFTTKKLTKREVYPFRIESMKEEQENVLGEAKRAIDACLGGQLEDFDKNKSGKAGESEAEDAAGDVTVADTTMGDVTMADVSMAEGNEEDKDREKEKDMDKEKDKDKDKKEEPKFKFRFNDAIRNALYRAYQLEDQMSELTVEKQQLEKATERDVNREKAYSATNARKILYARIVELWPPGMMQTNQLSREISTAKKRAEKEMQRND